jgi:LacI family transcriptional regulator
MLQRTADGTTSSEGAAPGAKVTLTEIAAHAGVSRATVSLVLRESPLVRDETRQRVLGAIKVLNYVYDRGAARMRGRHSQTVGVIIVDLTSSFYAELTAGIDAALDRAGRLAFLANTGEDLDRQARVLARFREQAVDGVILCPAEGATIEILRQLTSSGLPCVQVLRHVAGAQTDYVGTDNRLGTTLATEHLLERGHERIAFVGGDADTSVARDRKAGYLDAMQQAGLVPRILLCPNTKVASAAVVQAALLSEDRPTGFVCFNDPTAMGAMSGASEVGQMPGDDVAIVGFDDIGDAALTFPSLSSVAIQPKALGEAAAELLLKRIESPGGPPSAIIMAPRLVIRASSLHSMSPGRRTAATRGPRA